MYIIVKLIETIGYIHIVNIDQRVAVHILL
jgi:hypothetical protein